MKCQNCGKNEVNFHYSSNVNGCVTEAHLCLDCAEKQGFSFSHMLDSGNIIENFFPPSGFYDGLPKMPVIGFRQMFPYCGLPVLGVQFEERACENGCAAPDTKTPVAKVDGEMRKRREINAIREQMRIAADKEDFEKAAELRDKIKQINSQ